MDWQTIASEPHAWLDLAGPSSDIVISTRVRLARNIVDVPFPERLEEGGRRELLEQVLRAASLSSSLSQARFIDMKEASKTERQFLMERHLISPEMAFDDHARGVLIGPGQLVTLMINEEDHLRLQSFSPGFSLRQAYNKVNKADNELGDHLAYAFDAEWGFCTRCPTNAGTGLRVSCLLHLPALAASGDLERVLAGLAQMNVAARGFYGESSKAIGNLIQISNTMTLGHSEQEYLENMDRVIQSVMHVERQCREAFLEPKRKAVVEDQVWRSWGLLRNARLISYDEAMSLISQIRLGLQMGLQVPAKAATLNQVMLITQPAHLQLFKGRALKTEERDRARASLIREKLGGE